MGSVLFDCSADDAYITCVLQSCAASRYSVFSECGSEYDGEVRR